MSKRNKKQHYWLFLRTSLFKEFKLGPFNNYREAEDYRLLNHPNEPYKILSDTTIKREEEQKQYRREKRQQYKAKALTYLNRIGQNYYDMASKYDFVYPSRRRW